MPAAAPSRRPRQPSPLVCPLSPEAISRAYNNRLLVPHFQDILADWARRSALALAESPSARLDIPYGDAPLERLDVFPAGQPGAPVMFFIHGGYWRMMDKCDHRFLAPAFNAAGAAVVIPNYTLAPAIGIDGISLQVAQALAWTWRHAASFGADASRIVVAGHSAGGHLTGMMMSLRGKVLGRDFPDTLSTRGLAISGLFDLAPLRHCEWLQPDIRLTPASVRRLSPAGFPPPAGPQLWAISGGDESSEFHRQGQLIQARWGKAVVPEASTIPGRNHFDILLDLAEPGTRLNRLALGLLGLPDGEALPASAD